MTAEGDRAESTQLAALHAIPARDMLVDPADLEKVLEEPSPEGGVSLTALITWTLASIALTIIAAIWWAAAGH